MTHTIIRIQHGMNGQPAARKSAGLIMSATLAPPLEAVARSDPKERLKDYLDALGYYLSLPNTIIDRILFVDNSNGDLAPLAELAERLTHEKSIELISFAGNDHPFQRGKAYGEFKLMDYGLAHTGLFDPDDIVWKTTGRLKLLNLPALIESCRKLTFDVLCDLHNVPWIGSGKWRNYQNMDLRVFAFRRSAYDTILRDLWRSHEQGFDAGLLYHWIRQSHPDLRIIPRFPRQPILQGISGRHRRDYRSDSQRAKDAVRVLARRIAPWLWL